MKFVTIIFLMAGLLAGSSCKKLIEIKETDFIDQEKALVTIADNEAALIGAYATLNTNNADNTIRSDMAIRLNAVISDEMKPEEFYNSQSMHEWEYTYNDIGIRDNYMATTTHYFLIDRINRMLRALPNATGTDEALRNRVKGEALFLRAYAHFELYRYYCDNYTPAGLAMPYMEQPSINETFPRIPMQEYFSKIEKDLADAKPLVPAATTDLARANKMAVVGLQARVALYKKDWENAITSATEYINAIPLASKADFPKIWQDLSTAEVAFMLPRTTSTARMGSFFRGVFTKNAAGALVAPATISWSPSNKLWNSYDEANDIRFSAYLINEPILAAANKPSKIVKKYAGGAYASTTENVANIKLFRTAEMYLIRAEAYAESEQLPNAQNDLNALRAARINNYSNITLSTKEQAINEILLERFKELAYEGHRFWDLKRKGKAVERLASDAPNTKSITLPVGNFRFLMPIPQPEMQANSKMEQNPGYAN